MNSVMRISQDKEAPTIPSAPEVDVEEYEAGDEHARGPTLTPMRPNWENVKGRWNDALCDLFIAANEPEEGFTEEDVATIRDMFMDRLVRLKRVRDAASVREGETRREAEKCFNARLHMARFRQRPHTRRIQVSKTVLNTNTTVR